MTDRVSPAERSAIMRQVKRAHTAPELRLRAALRELGVRGYRLHRPGLSGRPDLSFGRARIAVFVDGCFWHGCARCNRRSATRADYWAAKIARNRRRDRRNARALRAAGWRVFRVWECRVNRNPASCARRLLAAVESSTSN